jgi:hypothetical protein
MQTQYLQNQTAQYGDLKPAMLLGTNGPSSYSQTTRDPVANPGAGDYIEFPMEAVTLSKNYVVRFYPLAAALREGAPSAAQSGWVAMWFNNTTTAGTVGNEVTAGTNLSAEQLVFGAFISQL